MKKLLLTAAVICTGSSAMAGALEFVPAPLPPMPAPVLQAWTGPYVGAQAGVGNADLITNGTPAVSLSGPVYGLHAGYLHDFGTLVIGAEVDYNLADISGEFDGEAVITDLAHLKARVGADLGQVLLYGTGGYAYTTIELFNGSSVYEGQGLFYGVGAEYLINANWSAGAEYLVHQFEDVGGAGFLDIDLTTIQARASYHF